MAIEKKSLISSSTPSTKNIKSAPVAGSKLQPTVKLAKQATLAKQVTLAKQATLAKQVTLAKKATLAKQVTLAKKAF